ncbi:MAG: ABC transporter permease [Oscillospiraceae bacterium]|nr:ABC transporter permease [Oscillospiraceae bacterium]MDD6145753.1 ABC transporter permease [Oscillospiraceae bacterium]
MRLKAYTDKFMKYRHLLRELVIKKIKLQYRNSFLGVLWTFFQPLLTMIVLTLIFSNLFGRDSKAVVNYPVYLLTGRLLHEFFTQSTKKAMKSIRGSASIIKKVYVPKYIYPLSVVISTFVTFLISLSVLALVILFFNIAKKDPIPIGPHILFAVVPIIVLFVLSLGVGMFLATLDVFFKDIENLYDVFTMLLFYITPIVYTVDRLGFEEGSLPALILKLNPMYGIIDMFRAAILHSTEFAAYFDIRALVYCSCFAVVILAIGTLLFYKMQDKFILHI